ncbi:ribosomal RNA small subunit methyltransferase A [Patescibacteria group bacterium]|nr:ribosomal RNA small subunit methyltransferase A [Patescibacteria group bacterium]
MTINFEKTILKRHNLKPIKYLGQNFLIDRKILDKIIETAGIKLSDTVVEIGPGTGILTKELAKNAKKVIAIEKDFKMCEILKESLRHQNIKNVEIVNADILKIDIIHYILPKSYKVISNIPYYITSPIVRKFLELKKPPSSMVLMVQKEVAQRICNNPPKMSILSVSVQFYAKPKIIDYVSKESFWPKPKVDSAILRITQIHTDKNTDSHRFFEIVKAGFSQPRKQLVNNLSKSLKLGKEQISSILLKNGLKTEQRAGTLNINDWINLIKSFSLIFKN